MNTYILKQLNRAEFTHSQLRQMGRQGRNLAMILAAGNDTWTF